MKKLDIVIAVIFVVAVGASASPQFRGRFNPANNIRKTVSNAVNSASNTVNDAADNAINQAGAAVTNVQEQASNALDQVSDAANGIQNQRTGTGSGSLVPIQAGGTLNAATGALGQVQDTINQVQQQAADTLGNTLQTIGNQASGTISQAIDAVNAVQTQAANVLGNAGAQFANTLGTVGNTASGTINSILSTFANGAPNVVSSQRSIGSSRSNDANDPSITLNSIAGGINPIPAFLSRIVQPSASLTRANSGDCGANGDALPFLACYSAKIAGLCTLDFWKRVQCRSTCGNVCCGDSLPNCQNVQANGLCTTSLPWADYGCRKSCGRCGFHDGN